MSFFWGGGGEGGLQETRNQPEGIGGFKSVGGFSWMVRRRKTGCAWLYSSQLQF
jgi:hypothetical protein